MWLHKDKQCDRSRSVQGSLRRWRQGHVTPLVSRANSVEVKQSEALKRLVWTTASSPASIGHVTLVLQVVAVPGGSLLIPVCASHPTISYTGVNGCTCVSFADGLIWPPSDVVQTIQSHSYRNENVLKPGGNGVEAERILIQDVVVLSLIVHVLVCMVILCSEHELVFGVFLWSVVFSVSPSWSEWSRTFWQELCDKMQTVERTFWHQKLRVQINQERALKADTGLIVVPLLLQWTTRCWRTRSLNSLTCLAARVPPLKSGFMVGKGMSFVCLHQNLLVPRADWHFSCSKPPRLHGLVALSVQRQIFKRTTKKILSVSLRALAKSFDRACGKYFIFLESMFRPDR